MALTQDQINFYTNSLQNANIGKYTRINLLAVLNDPKSDYDSFMAAINEYSPNNFFLNSYVENIVTVQSPATTSSENFSPVSINLPDNNAELSNNLTELQTTLTTLYSQLSTFQTTITQNLIALQNFTTAYCNSAREIYQCNLTEGNYEIGTVITSITSGNCTIVSFFESIEDCVKWSKLQQQDLYISYSNVSADCSGLLGANALVYCLAGLFD